MSELAIHQPSQALPLPSVDVVIRPGELRDLPFLDSLQRLHTKQVGWMPTKQFEGKIKAGHVLVAEEESDSGFRVSGSGAETSVIPTRTPDPGPRNPVGYLIGNDQYFKRDDVGIVYQLNVSPGRQRGLIGASLLKAQFERSAYGCKLYCCWCARDIAANHFWEAMGFVPLAYRAGGVTRGSGVRVLGSGEEAGSTRNPEPGTRNPARARVHIFWQKRIRSGDTTTPWWFPSQTSGGSIREDRIVLPIPPGTHWSDAKPLILPGQEGLRTKDLGLSERPRRAKSSTKSSVLSPQSSPPSRVLTGIITFAAPKPAPVPKEKPKREPKPRQKNDPRLVAAARELRDRWLEQVNANPALLPAGKYDVSRVIEHRQADLPLLEAA